MQDLKILVTQKTADKWNTTVIEPQTYDQVKDVARPDNKNTVESGI